jgi:hypothetical protein
VCRVVVVIAAALDCGFPISRPRHYLWPSVPPSFAYFLLSPRASHEYICPWGLGTVPFGALIVFLVC